MLALAWVASCVHLPFCYRFTDSSPTLFLKEAGKLVAVIGDEVSLLQRQFRAWRTGFIVFVISNINKAYQYIININLLVNTKNVSQCFFSKGI